MPFMLLGKGPDDEIRLLRTTLWDTRKGALDEVARLTAEPAFFDWETEVFVIDLDQAMPVLLVRPAAKDVPPEEPGTEESEDGEGDADLNAVLSKLSEEETETPDEGAAKPESVEPLVVEVVDTAWAEAVLSTEATREVSGSPLPEVPAPDVGAAGIQAPASVRAPQPSDEAAPAALDEPTEADVLKPVESEVAGSKKIATWPWSRQASDTDEPAVIIDLDEPEDAVAEGEPSTDGPETAELPQASADLEPLVEATSEEESAATDSDFIDLEALVQDIEPAPEPPGYQPEDLSVAANMACSDCVYVETCPHAGERDPASCGSFQWK